MQLPIWETVGSLEIAPVISQVSGWVAKGVFAHLALADQGGPAHPGFAKLAPTDATTLVCAPCAN